MHSLDTPQIFALESNCAPYYLSLRCIELSFPLRRWILLSNNASGGPAEIQSVNVCTLGKPEVMC